MLASAFYTLSPKKGMNPTSETAYDPQDVELSVVVLCYQAGARVIPIVERLQDWCAQMTPDWQVVLVGNYHEGSGDRTPMVVSELARQNPRIFAVTQPKEGAMGWDARSGVAAASGRFICLIDGDGQFPIRSIQPCFERIRQGDLDMTMTYRESREDGWVRGVLSTVYNGLFRMLFPGLGCRDVNSKPKILTSDAYRRMDLQSNDWFIDAEIMIAVRRLGLRFEQIPIVFRTLEGRASFVRARTVLEFLANLVRHRIREFRL